MADQLDNVNLPLIDGLSSDGSATGSTDPYTAKSGPFKTYIHPSPVTEERKPWVPPPDSHLKNPGTARATIAASQEKPHGTLEGRWATTHQRQTVVQQHCDYWDPDHDGIIWPGDTYRGCRDFGWSPPLAAIAAFIINVNLSYPTAPTFLPDPFFRIWLDRVYKDKHGSDSMTYDNEGRFKPQSFEDIFAKYDKGNKGGLDIWDLLRFWKGQRMMFDFFGWSATFLECTYPTDKKFVLLLFVPRSVSSVCILADFASSSGVATYLFIWPEDGIMRKEDIRGVYDGSIFYKKAEQHRQKQQREQQEWQARAPRLASLLKKLY